jgi:DNA-binding CsgD family transcriptional regulator
MAVATQFHPLQTEPQYLYHPQPRDPLGLCYRLPTLERTVRLTLAEAKITGGLLNGESNQQLAIRNGVSSRTIAVQMQQLFDKLGVNSRHELLATLLQSSGDNLHAEHLARRTRMFLGATQVFNGGRLLESQLDVVMGVAEREWGASAEASEIWDRMLAGELALISARSLGDLRFLVLGESRRLSDRERRESALQSNDVALLKGLGSGLSNQRLAQQFRVSQAAVSVWAKRALAKLGMVHRAELIRVLSVAAPVQLT